MIFNHCSKRYCWPFEWFSTSSSVRSFTVCQEVLDISQMAIAFHRVSRPLSSNLDCSNTAESTFFHSSYGSFSNDISFRIDAVSRFDDSQERSSQNSSKFQCGVEVRTHNFLFFATARENFRKLLFRLLWSLCFARRGENPLGGKILNNDSVPVIVP